MIRGLFYSLSIKFLGKNNACISSQNFLHKNFRFFSKKLFTFVKLSLIIGSSKQEMATEPLINKPKEAIMTTQTIQITKPQLIGSEKQIRWANDIINNILTILGDIEIPQGATAEQIAHVQKL